MNSTQCAGGLGGELSRRAAALLAGCPRPVVEVSPEDASPLGIADGHLVNVISRRGTMSAQAQVTSRIAAGVIFGNFHFPGSGNVNNLANRALDSVVKIPEYKACVVRLEAAGDWANASLRLPVGGLQ